MKRLLPLLVLVVCSCGTARVLEEDQYALAGVEVKLNGRTELSQSDVTPYLKQQAPGRYLSRWIYNLAGKGEKWPSTMFRKIGTPPTVYEERLSEASVTGIESHLEYLGYFNSEVEYESRYKGRNVRLKYTVNPGQRHMIDSISYHIPADSVFRSEFSKDSLKTLVRPGEFLSRKLLEAEAQRSSAYFRKIGYFDFGTSHYSFLADTLSISFGGKLGLDYRIDTITPKFRISSVSVSYPEDFRIKKKVLEDMNTIHVGDIYNEETVRTTYSRLNSMRSFSSVNIGMKPASDSLVDCSITLNPSRMQGIKLNLEASANSSGLFGISPKINYYHKNIFGGGEWFNIGFSGNFQFRFNNNVRANEFGANVGISFPKFLGISARRFKGPNLPRTDVNVSYNYQNRPEYMRNIFSASYGFSGLIQNRLRYQVKPVNINYVFLSNIDPEFVKVIETNPFIKYAYQDHCDAGLSSSFIFATSQDLVPKVSYSSIKLNFDVSGNILHLLRGIMPRTADGYYMIFGSPFSQYVRGDLSFTRTWFIGREGRQSIAFRILAGAGYAYGNSAAMPFEKQFYSGGANSLRGWQSRAIGPGFGKLNTSFVIPSQTGEMQLETNLEYRIRMFWKLEAAIFADAGNVWTWKPSPDEDPEHPTSIGPDFYKAIAMDWGYGLRVNLDFIVLRLDLGHKLRDPSVGKNADPWRSPATWYKSNGFAIHFGVGYPF